ncbi:uncharacterized protein TNCV_251471 [Trichonephila clavipes]|nr:uncharacterized protein TNCV_251471 [Trichonephila clavipes]
MDAETATVLRGRAKAALTRTINFIDKNDQTFDKNDIRNKLEKLELTYTKFDKADAALPIESSEMEEFETKYYETKAKLQNILENLSPQLPFLATRCIKQIALDDKDNPNLSRVLQEDIYMDDLLSGADTPNNAISICKDIAHVLSTRGFHLRKWNSNSTEFLAQFSEHSSHDARVEFSKDSNESSKVLGLFWNSSNDTFGFQPSLELTPPLTKRRILSESSKIFDPLGLLSPCTVFMKIFYQKLWLTKTDWDSPIPQQLTEDWLRFQKAFNAINYLTVPRWVILTADNIVELHGFADASSLAYAAAIYCRQKHNGKIKVQLLVSKTKVAPVKQVSIPRLELCGAHLLSSYLNRSYGH